MVVNAGERFSRCVNVPLIACLTVVAVVVFELPAHRSYGADGE